MHPFIHIGNFQLPAFGLMMCLGMMAGFTLVYYNKRRTAYTEDELLTAMIYAIIAGMLGSKLLYWITELPAIIADPGVFPSMLLSGFVFYGALLGGAAGLWLYCKRNGKSFFALMDLFIPSLVIGQAFGRIGCFLAGCCYGRETSCPIGVVFPAGGSAPAGVPLVPTQLLESGFLFLLTAALVWLLAKRKKTGVVFGVYCIFYGVWRFIIEFYRNDVRGAVGSLSTSQFIGLFIIAAGALLLALVAKGKIVSRETCRETGEDAETDTEPEPEADAGAAAGAAKQADAEASPAEDTDTKSDADSDESK